MKNCNKCGAMIPDEAMFCTSCGAPIEEIAETTVLDDSLSEQDASIFKENDFDATGLLTEDDFEATGVLKKEPVQEIYSYESVARSNSNEYKNVNSAFMNPNLQQNQTQQVNVFQSQESVSQNKITYLDFFEKFASRKTKGNIKTTGIIAIITSVLSLALVAMGNYLSVIDLIVYAVLAVLILKKKSWVFTLVLACYSGLFTIIGLVMSGTPSGIFALVMAIMATINGKKLSDAYNNYIATGVFPVSEI